MASEIKRAPDRLCLSKINNKREKEKKTMPLVTSEKMLTDAREGGYAVGAFNVENMEMVKAVIAAARK